MYLIFSVLVVSISLFCSKSDEENEPETISYISILLSPENGGDSIIFEYHDLDGPAGSPAEVISPPLKSNTKYSAGIELVNLRVKPSTYLTQEFRLEGKDHQVFFGVSNDLDMSFEYADTDNDGYPIGLKSNWQTGSAGIADLQIIIKHKPNKMAEDVMNGIPTRAGGISDIEAIFPITITD